MILKSIELQNYRNYKELSLELDKEINILYGDNAQGKTNILEAVYVCGTTKSHRGSRDKELIRFSEEEAHIRSILVKNEMEYRIDMHLKKNKSKGIAVNGIPLKKASELYGIVNIVFFSPEDLNIIKNGPSERRRFLDSELCQLDKIYMYNLSNYNRIIAQRNKLLKDSVYDRKLLETLPIWEEQLVSYGKEVIKRRRIFIAKLNEIVVDIHRKLSGGKERLILNYENNADEGNFLEMLEVNREKDINFKNTSVGPHRDDICFMIEGVDVRKYGSQGQQRTLALSLKLAEIELVKKMIHDSPILLLDDVLSELDSSRQKYLLDSIGNIQTIITCTGLDEFISNRFHINRVYLVKDGIVYSENQTL
jgi:DNA replication and repair protein RecF